MTRIATAGAALAAALVLGACVENASAPENFVASNKFRVIPSTVEGAVVEVFGLPAASGGQYFCAAGDYIGRDPSVPVDSLLVIVKPEGPSTVVASAKSVHFGLVPPGTPLEGSGSGSINPRNAGEFRTLGDARQFCRIEARNRRKN